MKNYLQKMIGFLKPEHIWNYANSISFSLSDEEVMDVFNKIIEDVTNKLNAKLRNS